VASVVAPPYRPAAPEADHRDTSHITWPGLALLTPKEKAKRLSVEAAGAPQMRCPNRRVGIP